jgi:hypothetical protein
LLRRRDAELEWLDDLAAALREIRLHREQVGRRRGGFREFERVVHGVADQVVPLGRHAKRMDHSGSEREDEGDRCDTQSFHLCLLTA